MRCKCKISANFAENRSDMTPKWLFFDLDDTLFDFSSASIESLGRLWDESEEIRSKFNSPEAFIEEYHIHNSRMWKLHESGQITADFLKPERFRLTVFPESHDSVTENICRKMNDRYLRILGDCDSVCPDARETLEMLSKRCLIGVLTNGFTEVQYRKLRSTGLDKFIQRMVISDEIGIQKPDSRIFRHAERATGVNASEAVMIGDNPDNDIKGALSAGWKAIYYNRKGKKLDAVSPLLIGETTELADIPAMCGF